MSEAFSISSSILAECLQENMNSIIQKLTEEINEITGFLAYDRFWIQYITAAFIFKDTMLCAIQWIQTIWLVIWNISYGPE